MEWIRRTYGVPAFVGAEVGRWKMRNVKDTEPRFTGAHILSACEFDWNLVGAGMLEVSPGHWQLVLDDKGDKASVAIERYDDKPGKFYIIVTEV